MGDLLQLDGAERHAAVLAALAALEQLRDLREVNGNHTPADPGLIDLARTGPPGEAADHAAVLDRFWRLVWTTVGVGGHPMPTLALPAHPAAAEVAQNKEHDKNDHDDDDDVLGTHRQHLPLEILRRARAEDECETVTVASAVTI